MSCFLCEKLKPLLKGLSIIHIEWDRTGIELFSPTTMSSEPDPINQDIRADINNDTNN